MATGEAFTHFVIPIAFAAGVAVFLSLTWEIPYIYTAIGFSAWAFFGHVVTSDDDLPGGWSNPDGLLPFPWRELVVKGLLFVGLCVLAFLVPSIRTFGGAS